MKPCMPSVAVFAHSAWLVDQPAFFLAVRGELAGRDVACWHPLERPCHADVLLELANAAIR